MGSQEKRQHLEFIEEVSRLAGIELSKRFGSTLSIQTKSDKSIVTEADLASEKVILELIRRHYPDDLILSEEAGLSSTERPPGRYIWIIDPLDGTTNFANRYDFYCVSIGRGRFDQSGFVELQSGGVYDPTRNHLYLAELGQGAFLNGKRLHISPPRPLAQSFLGTGFYYQTGESLNKEIRRFARISDKCQSIRRDGAAALDLALVAAGIYDGFWEFGLSPWDTAAGALLITEAGGCVRNYRGNGPFNIDGEGLVAGSTALVSELQQLLEHDNES